MLKNFAHFLAQRQIKFLVFLLGAIAAFLYSTHSASAQLTLNEQSKVALDGIGPVRVGMTLQEG